ncbi:MAG: phosphotransferase [Chloroflexota bacterium]
MNSKSFLEAKPRVLIVDNNERVKNMYKELIAHWGFEPILAHGIGNGLLDDARCKARENRCQLALVDLRLVDDLDEEDVSGLKLVPEIKPTVSIIVSASVDIENIRLSDEIGAASYVGKGEKPKILREKLEREAKKICASWKDCSIGPDDILNHIVSIMFDSIPVDCTDQITDIFVRLFPNAKNLQLERLGTGSIASTYSTVPRPKSVILKVYEDNKQPVIVKLARAQKMSVEADRFQNYIYGRLKGYFHPLISNPIILWDIGGAIYTSLGSTDSHTFSQFYNEASFADIEYSLRHFFCETWSPLYAEAKKYNDVSLFEKYCKVWGKEWYERVCKFHVPDPRELMQNKLPKEILLIDPITWLQEKMGHAAGEDRSITDRTALAVTHGDLHGDNLLIDEHRNAWVIDFERSGEGHVLQDFVELESDIINRLMSARENLPSFYRLCVDVTQSTELKNLENLDRFDDADVKKSMQTISLLRQLAQETTGISDARQYLLGLLFNTLFRATIISASARTMSQYRALMLASIICHRLDHWNDPWPPEEWKNITKEGER